MDKLPEFAPLPAVGCENHQSYLTHSIIRFYLMTRMFFITKQVNKNETIEKQKTKERRKLAKLPTSTKNESAPKKRKIQANNLNTTSERINESVTESAPKKKKNSIKL